MQNFAHEGIENPLKNTVINNSLRANKGHGPY